MDRKLVSCYRTKDFKQWEFCADSLTLDAPSKPHPYIVTDLDLMKPNAQSEMAGCNIERPKVLYNAKTKQYVMWMHWEEPDNYLEARCAVAVSDSLETPFTYLGSFNPIGHMSRDCTMFQDDDGTAYFISSARDNYDLHIYKLTEDYLSIDSLERILWPGQEQEAPVIFKKDDLYYILTSGCTGWDPNQSSYGYSTALDGDWSIRKPLGDDTTFRSQPTWVLPITQNGTTEYWYVGDRWSGAENYEGSEYVILPLTFHSPQELELTWQDNISIV